MERGLLRDVRAREDRSCDGVNNAEGGLHCECSRDNAGGNIIDTMSREVSRGRVHLTCTIARSDSPSH